jgi:hypothetical protein
MYDVPVHLGGFSLQPIMVQNKQLTEKRTKKDDYAAKSLHRSFF